jgi:hypothetical protein
LNFSEGGKWELNALFMFIKTENRNTVKLISVATASRYPTYPITDYPGMDLELKLDANLRIHYLWSTKHSGYWGFENLVEVPEMSIGEDRNRGRFQLEAAGSQLAGKIISFNIEKSKIPKLKPVGKIK